MNARSRIFLVGDHVRSTLEQQGKRIFTPAEMEAIIRNHLVSWSHPPDPISADAGTPIDSDKLWAASAPTTNAVLKSLLQHKVVTKVALPFPYRTENRYVLGQVSNLDLVQSLDRNGYYSHFTALRLNELTNQIPKTIYFNVEQGASSGGGHLTQAGLDRAFKLKPRVSSNVIEYNQVRIHRLSGGNTGQLGVIDIHPAESVSPVRVTNIERTLIDATVRPVYSGGIAVVAKAFEMASDRVSVDTIADYLRKLTYTYPYHQAIGFYLQRAGYGESRLSPLRAFPMEFDFYLSHGIKSPEYNKEWRLFVPKGF